MQAAVDIGRKLAAKLASLPPGDSANAATIDRSAPHAMPWPHCFIRLNLQLYISFSSACVCTTLANTVATSFSVPCMPCKTMQPCSWICAMSYGPALLCHTQ